MNNHIPNPNFIKKKLESGVELQELDMIIHPGLDGELFRSYSKKFLDRLSKYNINTYENLVDEVNLINNKKSNLPSQIRKIAQGQLKYYRSEIERYQGIYDELSQDQKEKLGDHIYFIIKDESSGIEVSGT